MRQVLRRKGRVLDVMRDDLALLRRQLKGGDAKLLEQLAEVRRREASVVLVASSKDRAASLASLRREATRLERDISGRSAAFREVTRAVTIESVQQALPTDGALVEYVTYLPDIVDVPHGKLRYAAYVLLSSGAPRAVDLGDAGTIDELVQKLRRMLADPRSLPDAVARELDQRIMQPVRPLLGGKTRIFISPEGALQLVPFAALRGEDHRPLVSRFSFTYLASGRDLLRPAVTTSSDRDVALVGAPVFGKDGTTAKTREGPRSVYERMQFPPLPGTADELGSLAKMLPAAKLVTGVDATESAVKRIRAPRVLHIATHGFFLPVDSPVGGTTTDTVRSAASPEAVSARAGPMLRSGLAFAGANRRVDGADDGILTALEASTLDLSGTQLVVLSACETGLGEIRTGQGVHGLRRALTMAGAETQVMSLWRVDDEATQELMRAYYRQLLAGRDRIEAMRRVQLELLAEPRTRHPFYWASFIVSGQGGPVFAQSPEPTVPPVEAGPRGCGCRAAPASTSGWWALIVATMIGLCRRRARLRQWEFLR